MICSQTSEDICYEKLSEIFTIFARKAPTVRGIHSMFHKIFIFDKMQIFKETNYYDCILNRTDN